LAGGGGAGVLCCWAVAGNATDTRVKSAKASTSLRHIVEAVMTSP